MILGEVFSVYARASSSRKYDVINQFGVGTEEAYDDDPCGQLCLHEERGFIPFFWPKISRSPILAQKESKFIEKKQAVLCLNSSVKRRRPIEHARVPKPLKGPTWPVVVARRSRIGDSFRCGQREWILGAIFAFPSVESKDERVSM